MFDMNDEYERCMPVYQEVERIASELLSEEICKSGVHVHQLTHRIKEKGSAIEKLERKSGKYSSFTEFTDMVGFRIIFYFAEQINVAADIAERIFDVDWENSIDKRKAIAPTAFGYISLHYICSLPADKGYPEELCNVKFEIQMRSILQHAWAEIEHDLGYKTEFAIPRNMRREFSRVAGLLEIADECFDNIRSYVTKYEHTAHDDIMHDNADDMTIDLVTLKGLITYGSRMCGFNRRIADISGAVIREASPESYIVQLECLGIHKIGDIYGVMDEYGERAFELARSTLEGSEIEEVVNTVGLYYLCRAKLIYGDLGKDDIEEYYLRCGYERTKAEKRAEKILKIRRSAVSLNE